MGDLTRTTDTDMDFNQKKFVDDFCEQLHTLSAEQRQQVIDTLLKKLGASNQVQMFGTNQNVVGAYQLIITSESFEKMCGAIEGMASGLKESNPELTIDLVKMIVQALATAISK